jgi:hypothetical protein
VETSNNRKDMSKVINRADEWRQPDEDWSRDRDWYRSRADEDFDDELENLPDAWLIRGYLRDSKGLHVRRTLDQSHYSMLPSTEERDVDQILLKRGKLIVEESASKDSRRTIDGDLNFSNLPLNQRHHTTMQERFRMLWERDRGTMDESSLKVVMVDQLWLWMFKGMSLFHGLS